ncbi:hypothetical protein [Tenacibaculum piscium]|uniref:hypothetical protein n=1 Tax=Tenacibaculum piscium TaxID=1458515 RepID=UPI001F225E7C|nr:hypothetical protein [Tenacibaculum piscium]
MSFKYDDKQRLDWLKSVFPEFKKKPWHNEPVYHPEIDFFYEDFFKQEGENELTEIDPSKIIGIKYSYLYNGNLYREPRENMINWMHLFHSLVRLDRVIDNFNSKKDLIEHIHRNMDEKHVRMYGTHYISTSGQHRLCLAKLLGLKKVKAFVTKYKLDKPSFVREKRTEKNYNFYIANNLINDKYNISSQKDWSLIHLYLDGKKVAIHKNLQSHFIGYYTNLKNYQLLNLLYPLNKHYKRTIEKAEEIKDLKYLIARHKSKCD